MFSDPHWCSYSSIVTGRNNKYSVRLSHLIDSMNFVEQTAIEYSCDAIFCLGDFFDKSMLSAEEITALGEIVWSDIPHLFLVGNHEVAMKSTDLSSTHLFNLIPNCTVIDSPQQFESEGTVLAFLPYINSKDLGTVSDYLPSTDMKRIIFSHNDLKGVQLGKYISQSGFDLEDLENNCFLCFNGHLHNSSWVANKVFNIGNLCGQNFGEDAFKYSHNVYIYDTNTDEFKTEKNLFALNFYKLDFTSSDDFNILNKINNSSAVCTVKCTDKNVNVLKEMFNKMDVVNVRYLISKTSEIEDVDVKDLISVDHYKQFYDFAVSKLGDTKLILDELNRVVSQ